MTKADRLPLSELFRVFGRIGLLSFGGPAAQIALMHRELVDARHWLSEDQFLRALSLCMLLPGPEAMQLATYAGWRLRGWMGGLIAGGLFVLPGAAVVTVLALSYAHFGAVPLVQAAFTGIKAAVIVIVLQALVKLAGRALGGTGARVLAAGSFTALFVLGLPYPLVILAAALAGAFLLPLPDRAAKTRAAAAAPRTIATLALWGTLWALPVLGLIAAGQGFLTDVALFFSKLAVVTFGGAYAVLAYMTQTVVTEFSWISTGQMIDALGLAETTPGPLILVVQFVAILAGFAQGGTQMALLAGVVALWVTFVPCFLWIFLAGPYLEAITSRPRIAAALSAITAAVVGVICNLALWFAIHALFTETTKVPFFAAPLPVPASMDLAAVLLTLAAWVLLVWLKRGMPETLGLMAVAGVAVSAF